MSKVFSLYEGSYSVDASKAFIPFDPTIHNPKDRPASIFVQVQPFLIENGNDLLLLDTGLGYLNEEGLPKIYERLAELGYEANDVTKVLMTHLHFDHAGGMMFERNGVWEVSFPFADYYLQSEELSYALSVDRASFRRAPLEALRRYSGLHLLNGNEIIDGYIHFEITGGHSPHHQVIKIQCDDAIYFFGGDVMPEANQVLRRFIAKYDFDGRKAMELRQQFGEQAAKENWICLMYHDKRNAIVQFEMDETAALRLRK